MDVGRTAVSVLGANHPKAEDSSPEAELAYKKVFQATLRQAQPVLQKARRQAKEAWARVRHVKRQAEQVEQSLQAARTRVESAWRNQAKEWSGLSENDAFSADFNSNRDPGKAQQDLYELESTYTELQQSVETLQGLAQEVDQLITDLGEEVHKNALEKAEEARQKVWDRFDAARLQARQEALNRQYQQWARQIDSRRLEHWTRAAADLDGARRALDQETFQP